jgi:nicotinamide-nucleotide amidase
MPSAEIVTIGTELLLGQLVDTNTAVVAKALADAGIDVYRQTSVGDNEARIADAIRDGMGRADIVLLAGGLGPTVDDLTRDAAASATNRALKLDEPSMRAIEKRFAKYGLAMSENNRRQAMFPDGATPIDNPNGSAPGFFLEHGANIIIALPGPPRELTPMLHDSVVPWLVQHYDIRSTIVTRVLHTTGVSESAIDDRIDDLFRTSKNPSIAVLAHVGLVDVKITAKAADAPAACALIAALEPRVRERLGDCVYAVDDGTLSRSLGDALRARGWTIATAESCTGGMLGAAIAAEPGASDYFRGGIIAYANDVKQQSLGVPAALIGEHGAVSEPVAAAMAVGACRALGADVGLSITGVAGPGGATADKPVGLVYIAIAAPEAPPDVRRSTFIGDRTGIQRRATFAALALAWRTTRKKKAGKTAEDASR